MEMLQLYRPLRRGNGFVVTARYGTGDDAMRFEVFVPDRVIAAASRFVRISGDAGKSAENEVGAFWDMAAKIAKGIASNPLARAAASVIPGGAMALDAATLPFALADATRKKAPPNSDLAKRLARVEGIIKQFAGELAAMRKTLDELRGKQTATRPELAKDAARYEKRKLVMRAHSQAMNDDDGRQRLDEMAGTDADVGDVVGALDAMADVGLYDEEPRAAGDDDPSILAQRITTRIAGDVYE